jgi:hypothetical protein
MHSELLCWIALAVCLGNALAVLRDGDPIAVIPWLMWMAFFLTMACGFHFGVTTNGH